MIYSTPHDNELAGSESPGYRDYQNTMPSIRRPVQTAPPGSLTSAIPQARRFASPGRMRTGDSPNCSTAVDNFGFPADTSSYTNMSMNPNDFNGHMNLTVPSNRYFPYRREEATTTQWQRPQNYFSPANYNNALWSQNASGYTHPAATNELQSSSGYGDRFYNPSSFHGPHNTAEEFWLADTPVTGRNLPPSRSPPMQYPHGYAPGASSSYPEPSSHRERPSYRESSPYREPSSYRGSSSYHEPSSYPESSAHNFEVYRGSRPQWYDSAIGDPQPPGPSFPEQPVPSMTPLLQATAFSQPYTSYGGDMGYYSYPPPSTQPRQDIPRHNSHSRQSSRSQHHQLHSRPHTQETRHSPYAIHTCGWVVRDNTICGFEGPLDAFKKHFRSSHLTGTQASLSECHWQGCKYHSRTNPNVKLMRRDSAWRHVRETHLGMKRGT